MLSKISAYLFWLIVLVTLIHKSTSFKRNGLFDLKKHKSKDSNSLPKDEKIDETSISGVYDGRDDDDDDDTEDSKKYDKANIITQIKDIWQKHIQVPPSDISQINNLTVSSYHFTNNFQDVNHSDYNTLYRQLLTQFLNPFKSNIYGGGNQWFDRDFILDLKGRAVLAHRSEEMLSKMPSNLERKAVRLLCSTKGSGHIQQVFGYALAHSINSNAILLVKEAIEDVRQQCIAKGVPKSFLSRSNLVSILFDFLEEKDKATVILMSGHVKWILQSEQVSEIFIDELRSKKSKIFIVITESTDLSSENHIHVSTNTNKQNNNNAENLPHRPQINGNMPEERFVAFPNMSAMLPPELLSMFPPTMMGDMPFSSDGGNITIVRGTINIPPEMQQMFQRMMEQQNQQRSDGEQSTMTSFNGMIPIPDEVLKKITESQSRRLSQYKDANNNLTNANFDDIINNMIPPEVLQSALQGIASHIAHIHTSKPVVTPDGQVIEIRVHGINLPAEKGRPMLPSQPPINPKIPRFFFKGPPNQAQSKNIFENVGESGKMFMTLFDELKFDKPKDHKLKLKWDNLIKESNSMRILSLNSRLFQQEISKYKLNLFDSANVFEDIKDVLKMEALSVDQISEALSLAIKLEAGAVDVNKSVEIHMKDFVLHSWSLEIGINLVLKKPVSGKMIRKSLEEMSSTVTDNNEKTLLNNVILPQDIGVTYDMIGGLKDVKEILRQSITYPLKYPHLYEEGIAQEAIKGVLLFGPPGTGKTLLAKAVATEGGATFLSIDASTIENKWLGESEKNAKAVFNLARRLAPCVIYLDEVDSILSSREHGDDSSHGTLTSVKTTLMQEWDGLRTTKDRIVVIASTNRPFDLDEAVLRRLPRRILVDLPDIETRKEILNVTLANNRLSQDVNLSILAERLEGYTGSDIKEVCREAVVSVSHKIAHSLESESYVSDEGNAILSSPKNTSFVDNKMVNPSIMLRNRNASIKHLRSVNMNDFELAIEKLKASVDKTGSEMSKVIQWNEKYGETKKKKRIHTPHTSMYI